MDDDYDDKVTNAGSHDRPCWRHVTCGQAAGMLKAAYNNMSNGDEQWAALHRDGVKLKAAVVAVRSAPGTDLRTESGKMAKEDVGRECQNVLRARQDIKFGLEDVRRCLLGEG